MKRFERDLLVLLPRLRRFARALSHNGPDADDLCQLAIERALRMRDRFEEGTRLDAWMYRIMRNIWIDEIRARQRREALFSPEEAGVHVGDDGERRIEARAELAAVDRAMAALPDDQREAIALVMVEGLAYREAAEILDVPIGTLTSRLVRGRQALLAQLGEA